MRASEGPPKFWDYDDLHEALRAAVLKHVESRVSAGSWETIFLTLLNQTQNPYEIRIALRSGSTEHAEPTEEINRIVRSGGTLSSGAEDEVEAPQRRVPLPKGGMRH